MVSLVEEQSYNWYVFCWLMNKTYVSKRSKKSVIQIFKDHQKSLKSKSFILLNDYSHDSCFSHFANLCFFARSPPYSVQNMFKQS